jgi:threonine dehydrogenase-like Zn-dependent dehydrogenase
MRALVFTAPGEMELRTVAEPLGAAGSVVLDVRAAGICGSELHGFRAAGFRTPPLVMGHEIAGTAPDGRRVVVNPLLSCGGCDRCLSGMRQVCRRRELVGVHRPGGFAERVAVPVHALHELPPGMSWQTAAMVEPLANAVHAWRLVDPDGGGRVAVVGAGAIGLVCLLWARRAGVEDVTVVDRSPQRLTLAERLGASTCSTALDGEYDTVLDAVGAAATRHAGVAHLRPGGTAVWLGLAQAEPGFDGNDLVRSEKRVVGSFAYTPGDFVEALGAAAGLDLGWTTAVGLEEARGVFMALADGAGEPVKAVITPSAG